MCVLLFFDAFFSLLSHCFFLSVSLCVCVFFLCLLFCYLYEAQFFVFDFILFSINVFPIILVIIIIILSTTLFSIICKWTTFAPEDGCCTARDVCPPCLLLWCVLRSVRGLEAKILAPNWRQRPRDGPTTMTAQSELSTEPRTCARGLQGVEVIKFIYLFLFCFV